MTISTPSGKLIAITPGRRWHDGEWYWTGTEDAETLAKHGYIVQPDPPPKVPTPAEVAAQAAAVAAMEARAPDKLLARIEALESKVAKLEKETPK